MSEKEPNVEKMTTGQSGHNHSLAIRQEIQRFESVHPSIYAIYDLIELVSDAHIAKQIREHVVAIEGTLQLFTTFLIDICLHNICIKI